ncbi:MAG: hypothetical protein UT01_C0058G0005 [Candidatus Daviesbacteria bacterium GW2011_GWA1_38_7]|nr:MAG: hypothetical protein UT01_C0058G0005 [Candidatus Daviesbacteria bacterium GW2011_GWA1_38_7]OGE23426.1 MAG: hypothetical protein A2688_02295 [Candidatus Daviesbacteria bacterium RIFCSPHIGHO2_01_FULL_38_8]
MNRVYAASPHWAKSVTFFLRDIERFALNYKEYQQTKTGINSQVVEYSNSESKTAGISGKLAYKW